MSEYWMNHLSKSLSDQGILAYIWYIDEDKVEWAGDMQGVFGIEKDEYPKNHAAFNGLINPQVVPERLSAVHEIVSRHIAGEHEASFTLEYGVRHKNGSYTHVKETAGLHEEKGSKNKILCGTLAIKKRQKRTHDDSKDNVMSFAKPSLYRENNAQDRRESFQKKIENHMDTFLHDNKSGFPGFLLAVGLDRTGMMNEVFGTVFTDSYIMSIREKLKGVVGTTASVYHIDGDVFGLLVPTGDTSVMAETAQHVLYNFLEEPLHTQRGLYSVSVSIGGICFENAFCDPATMITRSELAMQVAKEKGRGCFVSYEDVMYEMQQSKISYSSVDKFLSAFYDGRVQLAYQPVMTSIDNENLSKDKKISFYECFMRFIDENGRSHSAGAYIPTLERLGIIQMLDRYVVNMAVQELCAFPDISLAVNVSARSLLSEQWLRGVVERLRDRPSVAKRFIVEITETAAMDNTEGAGKVIATLQSMGVRVALDDFGAGYTSFSQLKTLGVDIVKIDKSFIRGLSKKENVLFVNALQTLANGMGIETVAEGAETATDVKVLQEHGVHYIQGYIYGYPGIERVWLPRNHIQRHIPFNAKKRFGENSCSSNSMDTVDTAIA